ncbi:hypothetical protein M0R45_032530 [Rubus argutus]|uniref:TF-B3 domain-containing protein n=1 Tax=Rubus argutus TaxID=59490 RepID=A0AAW1WH41_RUBAR
MASLPPPRFCATAPHFFKIILEDTSRQKLKIPKMFVMKYGKDLSNSVCLKLPSGSEWEVGLTRSKGRVWFEKGWPEFSMFCSLDYGNFLLFRYEGNSHFHVCIFDTSATEIDYPITMPNIEEADADDHLSIEILEDFEPSPKARKKSPLPCPPYKKMRTSSSGKADTVSESENTQPCDMFEKPITNEDSHCTKLEVKNLENKEKDGKVTGGSSGTPRFLKQTSHQVLGNAAALQRAYDFKTENPSFIVSLKPSDIQSSLSLPLEFAQRHLITQPASNITLRGSDGTTWSVEFTYSKQKARFQRDWLTFVKDNNLKVGDVCVFVLIKDSKLILRVVFFRSSEAKDWFSSHGEDDLLAKQVGGGLSSAQTIQKRTQDVIGRMHSLTREKTLALQRANSFKSYNPSFTVAMQPTYVSQDSLSLQLDFAKKYLKGYSGDVILRVSDGRTWSMNLCNYKNSKFHLRTGWLAFAKDNSLEVGDVCVFMLKNKSQLLFEVVFFRIIESANYSLSPGGNDLPTKKDGGGSTSPQRFQKQTSHYNTVNPLSATEKATAFNADKPSFRMAMQPSFIQYNKVGFPSEFGKRYLRKLPAGIAILRIPDGRTWSVKFKYDHMYSRAQLRSGWSSFVRDNSLKVGDVCVFTLNNCTGLLFEVVIFPTKKSANCPLSTGHDRGAIVQVEKKISPIIKAEPECSMNCEIGKNKMSNFSGQFTPRPSSLRASRVNLEAANKFSSDNPFFKVTLGSGHSVHVPAIFSRRFIKQKKQTVMLQVKDRLSPVNLVPLKKCSLSICGGWVAFAKENCLRGGDVCIFELMEMNDIVLKVHIFRC